MNREQKRAMKRKAESRGIDGHMVDVFVGLQKVKKSTELIKDGDKVRINISSIKNHPDYDRLSGLYKEFVESHQDDVFTAVMDNGVGKYGNLFALKEDPAGSVSYTHLDVYKRQISRSATGSLITAP